MRSTSFLTGSSSTSTVRPRSPRSSANGYLQTHAESQPTKTHMRTHLADFLPLPRHALFHVKVTIHQLWNVPFVNGRYSVRWKFQNVQSVRNNGLRSKMRASAAASVSNLAAKGKGRVVSGESVESNATGNESLFPSEESSRSSTMNGATSSAAPSPLTKTSFLPAVETGDLYEFLHENRGRTDYIDLRDHNVKWGQTINVLVQMDVQRDTKELQPSELKLVVDQLVIPGDPDAPQNPRLGAVYLNLAEYADEGPVTRRYLLRQSKINATLQLTVELTHIDGEKSYKSPPLRKGEVMAGVATILENSPYGSLPDPSFSRRPSNKSAFDLELVNGSRPSSPRSRAHSPNPESLRTTDNIIEAIFNPVPTSSTTPSPFTYYVPPKPRPLPALDLSTIDDQGEDERPHSAVSGSTSVSRSFSISTRSSHSHASASVEKPARQRWWHKFGHHRQEQHASSQDSHQGKNSHSDSPLPPSQSPSILTSSLPASSSNSRSSTNSHEAHEVDVPESVQSRPMETRLISGNEVAGAPQVFLRRPTTVGGRRPSDVGSNQSRRS